MINRRKLLGLSAGFGAILGVGRAVPAVARVQSSTPVTSIQSYKTLGRTGLKISDISFGSSQSADPDLVRHALDRGVTYFDTAERYRFGASETALGKGLSGVRDQVILASKTKASSTANRQEIMQALEGSLRRLQTDYLDIYFNHAVNHVSRMQNEEWWEFTELAKKQGKIRFRGMSGHGSRLVPCLDYSLDHDLVDVVLVAYNFGQDPNFLSKLKQTLHFTDVQPGLPRMLAKAKDKNVGVIAMKTLMGARRNDVRPFEKEGGTFSQAAFRWVLANPYVDALIVSMTNEEEIDEYVGGSGDVDMSDGDFGLLEKYVSLNGHRYCRHGCDSCVDACPNGVEIAEVLRTRMYDLDYKNPEFAKSEYGALENGAEACLHCVNQMCQTACPVGIPIATSTTETAQRLS